MTQKPIKATIIPMKLKRNVTWKMIRARRCLEQVALTSIFVRTKVCDVLATFYIIKVDVNAKGIPWIWTRFT